MNFTLVMGNNFQSTPRRVYSIVISMNNRKFEIAFVGGKLRGSRTRKKNHLLFKFSNKANCF